MDMLPSATEDSEIRVPHIFPFSANPDLKNDKLPSLEVYKKYLKEAFDNPRICNIIVDGDYGIGKSSIIRTFEKEYIEHPKGWWRCLLYKIRIHENGRPKRACADFLYVSLGDYAKQSDYTGDKDDANNQQNVLERRLLLQIYARFRKSDLGHASFRMVQERHQLRDVIVGFGAAVATVAALGLYFSPSIDASFKFLFQAIVDAQRMAEIENRTILFSCGTILLIASLAVFAIISSTVSRWHAKTATVKFDSFEASCEREACDGYLDQHTTEIIYCLEHVARKIGHTVVFEDLDRLEESACISLLARLREINHLVNLRLAQSGQHLRFLYVVNSGIVARIRHEKYADYVLPVMPCLNTRTAELIIKGNLDEVNRSLRHTRNWEPKTDAVVTIVSEAAPFLADYRTQFAVLNDYGILLDLYHQNNPDEDVSDAQRNALAFAIYKNLFPGDYCVLWQGKSHVLPLYESDAPSIRYLKNKSLLDFLAGGDNPFLSNKSLYYMGCGKDKIVEILYQKMKSDSNKAIEEIKKSCPELLCDVMKWYCDELKETVAEGNNDARSYDKVRNIIPYLIENNDRGSCKWLFGRDMPTKRVMEILSAVSDVELFAVYKLAEWEPEGNEFLFARLEVGPEQLDLTYREAEICQLGVGSLYRTNAQLSVKLDGGRRDWLPITSRKVGEGLIRH